MERRVINNENKGPSGASLCSAFQTRLVFLILIASLPLTRNVREDMILPKLTVGAGGCQPKNNQESREL
jgi:hypothetical protein